MIKLVALDVDGTLLNKELRIPDVTKEAVAAAKARGVNFAIVTGRMYQSAIPLAQELGLENMPLVAYNGAMIREYPSGRTIYHEPVPLEVCKALAAFCEARNLHLQAYVDDELYVPDLGPGTQRYIGVAKVKPHSVGSLFLWLQEPSTKLLIIEDPEKITAIQEEVRELVGPSVNVAQSYPDFLEIVNSKVNKGTALEALARSLGLEREEVMAVGDGMNDMDMINWAGTSFAIAHAPEALRRAATYVTTAGAGDGVAEALNRMGLTGEGQEQG